MPHELTFRRSLGRLVTLTVVFALSIFVVGCKDSPSALGPTIVDRPPPAPRPAPELIPVPRGPASLAIEALGVVLRFPQSDGYLYYRATIVLRETSGNSGATIQRVVVTGPDEINDNGPWCWGDTPIRVEPGRSLDVFHTEAGVKVLGDYCAPYVRAKVQSFPFDLQVTVKDYDAREGIVEARHVVINSRASDSGGVDHAAPLLPLRLFRRNAPLDSELRRIVFP